jgi:predicted ATPase/class 3 adenylate cyclase
MEASPPTGTVTFLFTDIEGSTKLWEQHPGAMKSNLGRHDALLRAAIQRNAGYVFKTVGDAFCVAFPTALQGLRAAIESQESLAQEDWGATPIKVRMGIHTGEVEIQGRDYGGYRTLSLVQRVMSAGHGGQILLTDATRNLVRDQLPKAVTLRDMGEHQLKGFLSPEHLWQLVAPDLPQNFPSLTTQSTIPNNLPAMLNRFVGRAHELQEVKSRLAQTRMLTLLGPGGTGKTRLALQAATDLLAEYEDRVYLIDLAPSRDADSALSAIARTVGLRERSDRPLLDDLRGRIKQRKMLLLLDNFEQVTIAASPMAELLRDCPELKMLVTSREALHVRGENVFPIPPLRLPQVEARLQSLEQLTQCEAIQLFIERARAVKPDFELTDENAQAVTEICVRLDGLPLAIELATARLNVFSPQALAERLGNRLKLLRGGARDLPARQQTLRDTIDWSYEILDAGEQRLFQCLSVFDSVTFEAIEEVASRIQQLEGLDLDIFEGVSSLSNKSLIQQVDEASGESRLRMLETIREFAVGRLDEDAAFSAAVRRAHSTFFAELTQSQWVHLISDGRESALRTLTADLENIQAAWRYWAAEGNLEQLGKFTDCLLLLYDARGWYHAIVELTRGLLTVLSTTVSTPERAQQEILLQTTLARALNTTKGFTKEVEQAYSRALELCEGLGEIPQLFPVLRGLSYFYVYRTEFDKGIQISERILNLAEHLNDPDLKMEGQMVLGYNLAFDHDLLGGLEHLEQSIAAYDFTRQHVRRLGLGANPGVVSLAASALCLWMAGFPDRGRKRMGEAVALSRKLDHPFSIAYALFHFALISFWLGNIEIAEERARALIDLSEEHEFLIWSAVGSCVRGAALVELGSTNEGLALIERGMQISRGQNMPPIFWPSLLYLQAGAYGIAARPAEGLSLLNEALQIASASSGKLAASEFLGLKGDLLLALDPNDVAEAESCYRLAVDTAREVKAALLELRAAARLSRLWQGQNRPDQAREVLLTAYSKMTEGFSTPDLRQARLLLEQLGQSVSNGS